MPIPKLVVTAALMAAQVAIGAMRKTEGPRLDNTHVTLADYGTPIPDIWGYKRIEGCPVFWAEELREQKKKSKGKAGKYAEYKYYGTWAIAVAAHEIEGIAKILFDNHPVYQMTGEGPVSSLMSAVLEPESRTSIKISSRNIAIYLGTETQSPDPRMEAWYEDQPQFGADCCPAHRGLAYIVFKDIPLEKFGNRIPQVTVDAVSVKSDTFLAAEREANYLLSGFAFSSDYTRFVTADNDGYEIWDTATSQRIITRDFPQTMFAEPLGIMNNGTIVGISNHLVFPALRFMTPEGAVTGGDVSIPWAADGIMVLDGQVYVLPFSNANTKIMYLAGDEVSARDAAFSPSMYIKDPDGNHWAIGRTGTTIGLECVHGDRTGDSGTFASPIADTGSVGAVHNGTEFVFGQNDTLFKVDPDTFTVTDTGSSLPVGITLRTWRNLKPGATSVWNGMTEVSLETLAPIRTMTTIQWGYVAGASETVYDPISNALITHLSGDDNNLYWLYLDRIGSDGVTFGQILEEEGEKVSFEVDGTALDQTVLGYSVTQGSVRDRLAPLFDIHDSILRPHDFGYQGLPRGTSSLGTILTENFVREGDEARYVIDIAQDTDLPQRLDVRYADSTADHQVNTVTSVRHTDAVDSVRVQSIDLTTYVDTPDAMQQKADRFLRRQHNSKSVIQNALTAKYLAVEPGDIYDLNLDGVLWTAQLEKLTHSAGAIKCEWRRTFPSLNTLGSGTGPDMGGHTPEEIFVPGPSKGFVLDIPLVEDADNSVNPLIYYAAGGYGVGAMPGAAVLQGDAANDDEYDEIASVASSDMATWGYTTNALGDANPNLWDRGNSVNVKAYGTLSTVTEAQINLDPMLNMAVLRNPETGATELFNFATATLEADGTYTLTKLLRGRRGTEWAVAGHSVGDEFVLVEDLGIESYGLSDVGSEMFFKVQTFGRDPDFAPAIEVDFEAATLKPYAPVIWHVTKDSGSGDITIEVRTRTRIGGAWNGSTIPTGETIAQYEFDVYDGDDFKRTLESTDKTFLYEAADQVADWGAEIEPEDLIGSGSFAVQLSASVGRGFARAA